MRPFSLSSARPGDYVNDSWTGLTNWQGFQQRPIPVSGNLVKREWLPACAKAASRAC